MSPQRAPAAGAMGGLAVREPVRRRGLPRQDHCILQAPSAATTRTRPVEFPQVRKSAPVSASGSPSVTVILPTYNRASFLRQAFASIEAQTFRDWELVIIDDGSTDDTRALVEGLPPA